MLTHQQALELALFNSNAARLASEQGAQVADIAQKLAKSNEDLKAALVKETEAKEAACGEINVLRAQLVDAGRMVEDLSTKLADAEAKLNAQPLVLPAGDDYRPADARASA